MAFLSLGSPWGALHCPAPYLPMGPSSEHPLKATAIGADRGPTDGTHVPHIRPAHPVLLPALGPADLPHPYSSHLKFLVL